MAFKTTRLENSILSILYHANALVDREQMTIDEIIFRMRSVRDIQDVLWHLKGLADHGIVEKGDYGWKMTPKGARHWEKLSATTKLPNI